MIIDRGRLATAIARASGMFRQEAEKSNDTNDRRIKLQVKRLTEDAEMMKTLAISLMNGDVNLVETRKEPVDPEKR